MHLAEQRHEERRLARASRADDEVYLAAAEKDLVIDVEHKCAGDDASGGGRGALRGVGVPGEGGIPDTDAVLVRLGNELSPGEGSCVDDRRFGVLVNELSLGVDNVSDELRVALKRNRHRRGSHRCARSRQ